MPSPADTVPHATSSTDRQPPLRPFRSGQPRHLDGGPPALARRKASATGDGRSARGRDELARHRIEQALGAIPGSPQSAAMASFGIGCQLPIGRLDFPRMGLAPSSPAYSRSTSSQVFFPIRRDQPNVVSASRRRADVALKPMHDPYLGDEPTTTDKTSPGAQAMRESLPPAAPINPAYLSRRSTPSMADDARAKGRIRRPRRRKPRPRHYFRPEFRPRPMRRPSRRKLAGSRKCPSPFRPRACPGEVRPTLRRPLLSAVSIPRPSRLPPRWTANGRPAECPLRRAPIPRSTTRRTSPNRASSTRFGTRSAANRVPNEHKPESRCSKGSGRLRQPAAGFRRMRGNRAGVLPQIIGPELQ